MAVYYFYEPTAESLYPKCIFVKLTGYQCAGCGMQRAIHNLLHLRIAEAFRFNAFFVVVSPILLLLLSSPWWKTAFPKWYAILTSQVFLWLLGIATVIWWVARNI